MMRIGVAIYHGAAEVYGFGAMTQVEGRRLAQEAINGWLQREYVRDFSFHVELYGFCADCRDALGLVTGIKRGSKRKPCPTCNGTGRVAPPLDEDARKDGAS